MKKTILTLAAVAMMAVACNDKEKKAEDYNESTDEVAMEATEVTTPVEEDQVTIADIAMDDDNFSDLEGAVVAADLGETLSSEGPYTVFAPTNQAFEAIPQADRDAWMKPENKEKLSNVLKYHVVPGKFTAADIKAAIKENGGSFDIITVQGDKLTATLDGEDVVLKDAQGNSAKVVQADVEASNGVIHAIDAVVMPKK
ncbi:MAG: beta-Ig-H3/fasciclin [Cytophagaceae bacterium]|nr:beta-Ig-H3/fasciclin [Cytophagaceae bacterium]